MCDLPTALPTDKVYDEKFVLFVRTTPDGATVLDERVVSRALPYHAEIVDAVEAQYDENDGWQVAGGGILTIDAQAKRVRAFGRSGAYGAPRVAAVQRCLEKRFPPPDWSVEARATAYVRG
jgi:hypothetical protein